MDFYEGAALYRLLREARATNVRLHGGLIVLDNRLQVYLKYSTRVRSPWSFAFSASERYDLESCAATLPVIIGLICGADGTAALKYRDFTELAGDSNRQIAISCVRRHNQHYAVRGPGGALSGRISPSAWDRLLAMEV